MRVNKTKAKLAEGKFVFGTTVGIPSAGVVEVLGYAGLDFVTIDAEHGPMDISTVEALVRGADAADIEAFVRLQHNDEADIARYLDIGVMGVQIPHVDTAEDARAAVQASKYHPLGMRGMAFARAARYDLSPEGRAQHMESSNRETMVICQVESKEAVANLSELLTVEGVDAFFIGPSDLSQSLGYPAQRHHPVVKETIERTIAQIIAAGKVPGLPGIDMEMAVALGVRFIATLDARLLMDGAKEYLAQGQAAQQAAKR